MSRISQARLFSCLVVALSIGSTANAAHPAPVSHGTAKQFLNFFCSGVTDVSSSADYRV